MTSQAASDGGTASAQIAVFLLDDHEVVRRGVRDLLEAEPDIRVVGEAGTASSARSSPASHHSGLPHVLTTRALRASCAGDRPGVARIR